MEVFRIVVLAISGLLVCYGGGNRLTTPANSFCLQCYLARPGVDLRDDPDISSEMRGDGAVLLLAGLVALAGTFVADVRITSLAVASVIFVGFAFGRLVSWKLDGRPNDNLVQGTIAESALGVLNVVGLVTALV